MFAYALFDTAIGRCGIAWGPRGVVGVQLPERSEMTTVTRILRHCPNAEEIEPPKPVARGIEGAANNMLHQHGHNSSQMPMGRSARASSL